MQGAITDLIAGVPVSGLEAASDWYTRFFGRPPDTRTGDEILWDGPGSRWERHRACRAPAVSGSGSTPRVARQRHVAPASPAVSAPDWQHPFVPRWSKRGGRYAVERASRHTVAS